MRWIVKQRLFFMGVLIIWLVSLTVSLIFEVSSINDRLEHQKEYSLLCMPPEVKSDRIKMNCIGSIKP